MKNGVARSFSRLDCRGTLWASLFPSESPNTSVGTILPDLTRGWKTRNIILVYIGSEGYVQAIHVGLRMILIVHSSLIVYALEGQLRVPDSLRTMRLDASIDLMHNVGTKHHHALSIRERGTSANCRDSRVTASATGR